MKREAPIKKERPCMLGPLFKPYRFVFALSLAKPTNNRKKNIIPLSEQPA